jgi:S1-C subfamily serine protease
MISQLGLPGILILDVQAGSKAEAAKLNPTRRTRNGQIVLGDIITKLDNHPVRNNKELLIALENYQVGDKISLTILRGGSEKDVEVELEVAD